MYQKCMWNEKSSHWGCQHLQILMGFSLFKKKKKIWSRLEWRKGKVKNKGRMILFLCFYLMLKKTPTKKLQCSQWFLHVACVWVTYQGRSLLVKHYLIQLAWAACGSALGVWGTMVRLCQLPVAQHPAQTGISLLQEAAAHQHHVATFKHWISGALGRLQAGHVSPPALLKLNPLLGATASPTLSVAWVEGSTSRQRRPSSTPGPSTSPPVLAAVSNDSGESKPRHHMCSKCSDTFPLPVMLAMHSLNHVEERPFTCPFPSCHYNSVMRGNVKRHIRISHPHHSFPG